MEVEILKSLNREDVLWRYMSLDKFVNIVSDESLFFSPLSYYADTDPFEGYPPLVALRAMYDISGKAYEGTRAMLALLEANGMPPHVSQNDGVKKMRLSIDNRDSNFKKLIDAVFKGTLVSCWYRSDHQSEAMWKLYSDQNKGVAIKTTVGDLESALLSCAQVDKKIFIGAVKYLDYDDENLSPLDCNVDGHIVPMLKRISFAHENEVRAFFVGEASHSNFENFVPSHRTLSIDVSSLIKAVYISPYAKAPFPQSVRAICNAFNLTCPVEESDLLSGAEKLFNFKG
ncbi:MULTISPECIES: DUF2971 domain-containing protein [Pseudomonas]|uniref:DUF2971 domain-containing protein n=1 Tax=Pseudomonas TaxID=286 RepID=UPI0011AFDCB8|nr:MULTISPECIES: DUF2971 domain-containing protein [Pseudomonas]